MSNEDFFLGRKNQVKSITNFLNSNKNNAALVYGRRQVGLGTNRPSKEINPSQSI